MNTIRTIDAEAKDLEIHVDLCAQRYQELDLRLNKVEAKIDAVKKTVETLHADLWKVFIGTLGTVGVSLITTFGVIYTHMK